MWSRTSSGTGATNMYCARRCSRWRARVATTVVVWALLGTRVADPHRVPLVLLIGLGLQFAAAPALTAVSRRWERAADRCSLELTGDRAAYETAFRRLARTNLSDLDPPRLLYLLLFTHPTPPERLAAAAAAR